MSKPRVCVLRAPGTNCDVETAYAFNSAGASAERMHLFRLLESPQSLAQYQVLCIPGGFSYGDDIGAGVIFSRQLRGRLGDAIAEFLQADKLVLGICNGFQVLLKAGILPDGAAGWEATKSNEPSATLTWNDNGKYTAIWVNLRVTSKKNVFLRGITELELPVAHAEGRLVAREPSVVDRWEKNEQIALCYVPTNGTASKGENKGISRKILPFPENPNGAVANTAGLCDSSGRVFGLMPHPERFLHATQHPQWTRRRLSGEGQGIRIFRNAVEYFG